MPEFAPPTRRVAGFSSPEQLRHVAVFAAGLGWRAAAEGDGWRLTGGDLLAAHPNDCRLAITVSPDGDGVLVRGVFRSLPWTRSRMHRIAARRVEQVADWLQASFAGTDPDVTKTDRRPFALAQTPAEYCRAFAGTVLMVCALMAGVMAVTTIASWFVMGGTLDTLRARVAASEAAGIPVLPPRSDLEGLGFGGRLAAAALLAMPIAFFIGAMQSLALVMAELWWRASRLPLVMSCLGGVAGALAFAQTVPSFLGIPLGLSIPAVGLFAASLVWGRRAEQTVLPPDPAKSRRRVAVAVFAVFAVLLLLPWPRTGKDFTDQLALFRDRYLLTHSAGIAYAHLYYRATLYSAEPTKQAFDNKGEDSYDKQAPLALVMSKGPQVPGILRACGFIPVPTGRAEDPAFDLIVADGPVDGAGPRLIVAPAHSDLAAWKTALAAASKASFRGRWLLEFVQAGWQAIYYVGAIFGVALVMAPLALLAGALYGRVDSRRANLAVGATFLVTVGVLLYLYADKGPELKELAALRRADTAALHKALESPFASVRHEAAYRLFKAKERPGLQPLLMAASDPDFRVRLWVAGALGRTAEEAKGTLIGMTADDELLVRYRAAEGLGLLYEGRGRAADPGVVNILLEMIRRTSWYEATYALEALRRIDPERW